SRFARHARNSNGFWPKPSAHLPKLRVKRYLLGSRERRLPGRSEKIEKAERGAWGMVCRQCSEWFLFQRVRSEPDIGAHPIIDGAHLAEGVVCWHGPGAAGAKKNL